MKKIYSCLLSFAILFGVQAQTTTLTESFDSPAGSLPAGWTSKNQSNPSSGSLWQVTNSTSTFPPQSGAGFAVINYNSIASGQAGTISNWLISPEVSLKDGGVISFYSRIPAGSSVYPDRLEVRVSTNGASTNTGTTSTDVGDFTKVVCTINPTLSAAVVTTGGCGDAYPQQWTKYTITLSGVSATAVNGRIAFRYFVTNGGPEGSNSNLIGVDNFSYQQTLVPVNDVSVDRIFALGKAIASPVLSADTIKAVITNNGTGAITNYPVTITVTGANSYAFTQNVNLASGASGTINLPVTSTNLGTNNISVTIPADDNNTNNSKSVSQQVTAGTISYADNAPKSNSIGYNTGSGLLLTRYKVNEAVNIASVSANLNSQAVGNTIYGVVVNSAGNIIGQSAPYVVQSSDSNNYVMFNFVTPVNIAKDTPFYIGIAQTPNVIKGYFPLNVQQESPGRAGAYYGISGLTGGTLGSLTEYNTLGRFMIQGNLNTSLPVKLISFKGERTETGNMLYWITASEINNKGFEVQHSLDGKEFNALTFVKSQAEGGNSVVTMHYNFFHTSSEKGNNYYRLKQMDKDGKVDYSNVIVISDNRKSDIEIVSVYPNPAIKFITVKMNAVLQGSASIAVSDINGRNVMQLNQKINAGENIFDLNISSLNAGTYFIKVVNSNGEVQVQKFIKK